MATSGKLTDKVAIVTGGCKGIGRGIVDVFVDHGAKVVVLDIDDETGNTLQTNGQIKYIHCNVKQKDQIQSAVEETVQTYGRIDCLINNAGWHPPSKTIDEFTTEEFQDLIDLNLLAHFHTCKFALPYLRKTRGNIVNISSLSAPRGQELSLTYCATKGGVTAMSKGIAMDEAKYGVRVNTISPGAINTPLLHEWAKASDVSLESEEKLSVSSNYLPLYPLEIVKSARATDKLLQRLGDPREIGETALFLVTGGTFLTGQDIWVDGGIL